MDRDVKMAFLTALALAFSRSVAKLRRLVIFPGFWFPEFGRARNPSITFAKIFKRMLRLTGLCFLLAGCLLSCSINNVKEDNNLQQFFENEKLKGTFGMFNNGNGQFTIYNLRRFKDSAYLPASTFKIVNALVGIQTGRVKDDSTIIPWDGVTRNNPEWNRDLTMTQAFHFSSVPWFQELARRIGRDTMQKWLDTLRYGALKGRGCRW